MLYILAYLYPFLCFLQNKGKCYLANFHQEANLAHAFPAVARILAQGQCHVNFPEEFTVNGSLANISFPFQKTRSIELVFSTVIASTLTTGLKLSFVNSCVFLYIELFFLNSFFHLIFSSKNPNIFPFLEEQKSTFLEGIFSPKFALCILL